MTKLRVLSGRHAGSFIDWDSSVQAAPTLGANDDFDIYIGDWAFEPIELVDAGEAGCIARWPTSGEASAGIGGARREGEHWHLTLAPWAPVRNTYL